MPAHRKPTSLLEAAGSLSHNPKRYADRTNEPQPTTPLGPPPKHFNKDQKAIWRELAATAPPHVLTGCDRWVVELATTLMHKLRSGSVTTAEIGHLRGCLAALGMTPADRSRVQAGPSAPAKTQSAIEQFMNFRSDETTEPIQ